MLKEVMRYWHEGTLMRKVVETVGQMLLDSEYVFSRAWEVASGQAVIAATEEPLREHDRKVNRAEREIRRMLIEHLTVNPGEDASGCLAMLLMAKDAERLGDYAKDIFKLGAQIDGKLRDMQYFDRMQGIQQGIAAMLPDLRRAVLESSDDLARDILNRYGEVKKAGRELSEEVADADLPSREAVATSLMVHYLRRANSHLSNVASGVIFPVENINYVGRGLRQEREK